MVHKKAVSKGINCPLKPRLNSLPGLPDAFDNKRSLYDNRLTHDEKGLKANPLPNRSVDKEARGNAMANRNLPSFISRNSTNDPLGTKSKALFLSGKQAKAARLLREETIVPHDIVEPMMIKTRSPEKTLSSLSNF